MPLLVLPLALAAEPDPVEAVGKAAGEWVKTRAETVRLQSEWSAQRELLEATVRAVQERANNLEAKRDDLKARTAQEQDELEKMAARNQAMSAALQGTGDRLKALDEKLVRLRPSLPPRLSAALELPYRSLAATELPLGERMQLTMTVLNRCVQFNRVVTHGEEVIQLPGDPEARALDVIYWGLSHGYALDRTAGRAWLGSAGPQGWQWEPRPDAALAVAKLIAIADDKAEPEFVNVPARMQHVGANSNP
ncbi:MAG TPA: DUF3450 family protein [Candidatus Limnocylindria bacterium]|nr:DUF3450 family protein [Candidatus Limnocylindria bacterium]HTL66732.1 DUF3450 family protein [Lacunisphaera sp.]